MNNKNTVKYLLDKIIDKIIDCIGAIGIYEDDKPDIPTVKRGLQEINKIAHLIRDE